MICNKNVHKNNFSYLEIFSIQRYHGVCIVVIYKIIFQKLKLSYQKTI